MLLVQILLVIRVIVILLRNFGHESVQCTARSLFAVHQHWVSLRGFDANLSIIILVVEVFIGSNVIVVLKRVYILSFPWYFFNIIDELVFLRVIVLHAQVLVIGLPF